jgi:hypothetical protein
LQGYKDKCPHNNPTLTLINVQVLYSWKWITNLNGNCRV